MPLENHPGAALDKRNIRKRMLASEWLSAGLNMIVTFDPLFKGVVLPDVVKHAGWPARLTVWSFHSVGEAGFSCMIRFSKESECDEVVIPWSAVFAMSADEWEEIHMWMADKTVADARHAFTESPANASRN